MCIAVCNKTRQCERATRRVCQSNLNRVPKWRIRRGASGGHNSQHRPNRCALSMYDPAVYSCASRPYAPPPSSTTNKPASAPAKVKVNKFVCYFVFRCRCCCFRVLAKCEHCNASGYTDRPLLRPVKTRMAIRNTVCHYVRMFGARLASVLNTQTDPTSLVSVR